jgi:hypothetical protein
VRALLAALTLVLAPAPGIAGDDTALPVPDAATLARMCSPQGTMQFTFGETGVSGSSKIEATLGQGFGMPASAAPFTEAQPRATEWSGRLMEMTYKTAMPKEAAEAYQPRLAAALAAAGWAAADMADGNQPFYLMAYGGGRTFAKPVTGGDAKTRVLAHIDYSLGELILVCGRDDLLMAHAKEALGELPPGTPRPQVPEVPLPPVQLADDCKDPAKLAAVNAAFGDRSTDSYIGLMLARTTWRDRLTSWMVWKIESSGKLPKERLFDVIMRSAGSASPGGNPLAALKMLPELFELVERLAKAETAKDQPAMCLAAVDFRAFMAKADAITLAQTKATQAALQAEATRLGVALD